MTFASARERNHSRLKHSSRNLPLKLSVTAFCQGLPGSINAVLIPCATIKDKIAFDTNSGPLSLRRKAGAPRSLTRRARTSITRGRADTPIDSDGQTLLGELVVHRQTLELLTIVTAVEHEIIRPYLVRPARRLRPRPSSSNSLPRALARQLQAGGPPQPVCSARAHAIAAAPEKDADAAIAVARILCRQLLHPLDDTCVLAELPAVVAQRRSRHPEQRAGPPYRETSPPGIRNFPPPGRPPHRFFAAPSLLISISRSRSATSFFSRTFSVSSCFRRLTSFA